MLGICHFERLHCLLNQLVRLNGSKAAMNCHTLAASPTINCVRSRFGWKIGRHQCSRKHTLIESTKYNEYKYNKHFRAHQRSDDAEHTKNEKRSCTTSAKSSTSCPASILTNHERLQATSNAICAVSVQRIVRNA